MNVGDPVRFWFSSPSSLVSPPLAELIFEQGDVIYVSRSWWEICERLCESGSGGLGLRIDTAVVLLQSAVCLGRSKTISDGYCTHT